MTRRQVAVLHAADTYREAMEAVRRAPYGHDDKHECTCYYCEEAKRASSRLLDVAGTSDE